MLKLAGLDIETTGLDWEAGHRVIELGMILYDYDPVTNDFNRLGGFTQRINPQRSIDPAAQQVHGIRFDDVAMEPTWEVIAPKLVKIMRSTKVIVAHNGDGFDLPFITHELLRIGLPIPDVKTVDTMKSARWATVNGKYPTLGELCFATGTSYDTAQAHAALYDVDRMMECFIKAHKQGFFTLPE